jgi:hypothetical protein
MQYGTSVTVLDMVCRMLLREFYWICSALRYWGKCIGYGLLYGIEGIVLVMVYCMLLGEMYWI